jgi:hypothetical protein
MESKRQGVLWTINFTFEVCKTYPANLLLPFLPNSQINEEDVKLAASYRMEGRVPCCIWKKEAEDTFLLRSGSSIKNLVGNTADVKLMNSIIRCTNNFFIVHEGNSISSSKISKQSSYQQLRIPKERELSQELRNSNVESSSEYTEVIETSEYLYCSDIFLNLDVSELGNSYFKLRDLCNSFYNIQDSISKEKLEEHWFACLDTTGWIQKLKQILNSTIKITELLKNGASVMVMEDSTSDHLFNHVSCLLSLSMLLLDKNYRTITGFEFLIKRIWLAYGHKFSVVSFFFKKQNNLINNLNI